MAADLPPPELDVTKPNVARMYDYYLGGKDNFAADRAAAERVIQALPNAREFTKANRRFLVDVVTMLAERGVRQFLDIGSGLPTQDNVHEAAQRAVPDARVVYVDHDPVVLVHARALLAHDANTTVIRADLREPDGILEHPSVRSMIDFDRPVALLMLAILHFVPEEAGPYEIVRRLRKPLCSGSYVAITHGHAGAASAETEREVRGVYGKTRAGDIIPRTPEQQMRFFEGAELVDPGMVPVEDWRPGAPAFEPDLDRVSFLGALARIP
ncbi:MAG: SAM-dependent methyltransferase [Streptosporangiales bacterium]|nr:SAM-dependent methyltransferase [Streptosporangiales bacterium]